MSTLQHLLDNNQNWSDDCKATDPDSFNKLKDSQAPPYLWIGCADSRVPANQLLGLAPGDVFVHRNIANVVAHTDLNCLSVIEYAVVHLKVQHIIVCGHYGCGGVAASMQNGQFGMIDNWLRHIRDVRSQNESAIASISDPKEALAKMCELNAVEQARNVCRTTIVQNAWERGQELTVHGWIYNLADGLLTDLGFAASSLDDVDSIYRTIDR